MKQQYFDGFLLITVDTMPLEKWFENQKTKTSEYPKFGVHVTKGRMYYSVLNNLFWWITYFPNLLDEYIDSFKKINGSLNIFTFLNVCYYIWGQIYVFKNWIIWGLVGVNKIN